jgi:hypothetical protein
MTEEATTDGSTDTETKIFGMSLWELPVAIGLLLIIFDVVFNNGNLLDVLFGLF